MYDDFDAILDFVDLEILSSELLIINICVLKNWGYASQCWNCFKTTFYQYIKIFFKCVINHILM